MAKKARTPISEGRRVTRQLLDIITGAKKEQDKRLIRKPCTGKGGNRNSAGTSKVLVGNDAGNSNVKLGNQNTTSTSQREVDEQNPARTSQKKLGNQNITKTSERELDKQTVGISKSKVGKQSTAGPSNETGSDQSGAGTSKSKVGERSTAGPSNETGSDQSGAGISKAKVGKQNTPGTSSKKGSDQSGAGTSKSKVGKQNTPGTSNETGSDQSSAGTSKSKVGKQSTAGTSSRKGSDHIGAGTSKNIVDNRSETGTSKAGKAVRSSTGPSKVKVRNRSSLVKFSVSNRKRSQKVIQAYRICKRYILRSHSKNVRKTGENFKEDLLYEPRCRSAVPERCRRHSTGTVNEEKNKEPRNLHKTVVAGFQKSINKVVKNAKLRAGLSERTKSVQVPYSSTSTDFTRKVNQTQSENTSGKKKVPETAATSRETEKKAKGTADVSKVNIIRRKFRRNRRIMSVKRRSLRILIAKARKKGISRTQEKKTAKEASKSLTNLQEPRKHVGTTKSYGLARTSTFKVLRRKLRRSRLVSKCRSIKLKKKPSLPLASKEIQQLSRKGLQENAINKIETIRAEVKVSAGPTTATKLVKKENNVAQRETGRFNLRSRMNVISQKPRRSQRIKTIKKSSKLVLAAQTKRKKVRVIKAKKVLRKPKFFQTEEKVAKNFSVAKITEPEQRIRAPKGTHLRSNIKTVRRKLKKLKGRPPTKKSSFPAGSSGEKGLNVKEIRKKAVVKRPEVVETQRTVAENPSIREVALHLDIPKFKETKERVDTPKEDNLVGHIEAVRRKLRNLKGRQPAEKSSFSAGSSGEKGLNVKAIRKKAVIKRPEVVETQRTVAENPSIREVALHLDIPKFAETEERADTPREDNFVSHSDAVRRKLRKLKGWQAASFLAGSMQAERKGVNDIQKKYHKKSEVAIAHETVAAESFPAGEVVQNLVVGSKIDPPNRHSTASNSNMARRKLRRRKVKIYTSKSSFPVLIPQTERENLRISQEETKKLETDETEREVARSDAVAEAEQAGAPIHIPGGDKLANNRRILRRKELRRKGRKPANKSSFSVSNPQKKVQNLMKIKEKNVAKKIVVTRTKGNSPENIACFDTIRENKRLKDNKSLSSRSLRQPRKNKPRKEPRSPLPLRQVRKRHVQKLKTAKKADEKPPLKLTTSRGAVKHNETFEGTQSKSSAFIVPRNKRRRRKKIERKPSMPIIIDQSEKKLEGGSREIQDDAVTKEFDAVRAKRKVPKTLTIFRENKQHIDSTNSLASSVKSVYRKLKGLKRRKTVKKSLLLTSSHQAEEVGLREIQKEKVTNEVEESASDGGIYPNFTTFGDAENHVDKTEKDDNTVKTVSPKTRRQRKTKLRKKHLPLSTLSIDQSQSTRQEKEDVSELEKQSLTEEIEVKGGATEKTLENLYDSNLEGSQESFSQTVEDDSENLPSALIPTLQGETLKKNEVLLAHDENEIAVNTLKSCFEEKLPVVVPESPIKNSVSLVERVVQNETKSRLPKTHKRKNLNQKNKASTSLVKTSKPIIGKIKKDYGKIRKKSSLVAGAPTSSSAQIKAATSSSKKEQLDDIRLESLYSGSRISKYARKNGMLLKEIDRMCSQLLYAPPANEPLKLSMEPKAPEENNVNESTVRTVAENSQLENEIIGSKAPNFKSMKPLSSHEENELGTSSVQGANFSLILVDEVTKKNSKDEQSLPGLSVNAVPSEGKYFENENVTTKTIQSPFVQESTEPETKELSEPQGLEESSEVFAPEADSDIFLDDNCGLSQANFSDPAFPISQGELGQIEIDNKCSYAVIDAYFKEKGLIDLQLNSYNHFMNVVLQDIAINCGNASYLDRTRMVEHRIEIENIILTSDVFRSDTDGLRSNLTPHEARLRSLTYEKHMSARIRLSRFKVDTFGMRTFIGKTHEVIYLGRTPVMVKSNHCLLNKNQETMKFSRLWREVGDATDLGGYFIINGKEKVIVTQEHAAENQFFVYKTMCDSKYEYEAEFRSSKNSTLEKVSAIWIRLPLVKDTKNSHNMDSRVRLDRPGLVATIPFVQKDLPIYVLLMALGFQTHADMKDVLGLHADDEHVLYEFMRSIKRIPKVKDQEDALLYIGKLTSARDSSHHESRQAARDILNTEVFPNIGKTNECNFLKGYHIGHMIVKLIQVVIGRRAPDDRDHLCNKRHFVAGTLLGRLYRSVFLSLSNRWKQYMERKVNKGASQFTINEVTPRDSITSEINRAMATGIWGDRTKSDSIRSCVTQHLNRLSYMATLCHLRRVDSSINRLVRMIAPRQIHSSYFGMICPSETPEGESVGLVKAFACMSEVSSHENPVKLMIYLNSLIKRLQKQYISTNKRTVKIILNGRIVGLHNDPLKIVKRIKYLKLFGRNYISHQTSIVYVPEDREIRVRTDGGRVIRPLLVVKENRLLLERHHVEKLKNPDCSYGWKDLVQEGLVEYLDTAEEEQALIAMFPCDLLKEKQSSGQSTRGSYRKKYTHCEIHPSTMLGIGAALIPFIQHNQSPRNTYQTGILKQSLGMNGFNYRQRFDTSSHVLCYSQKPIVNTRASKFTKEEDFPAGINVIVAFMCYSGYNQEDSMIINRAAVERGLFRSLCFRSIDDSQLKDERFEIPLGREKPKINRGGFKGKDFSKLEKDGLPPLGVELDDWDVVIGKTKGEIVKDEATGVFMIKNSVDVSQVNKKNYSAFVDYVDSTMISDYSSGNRVVRVRLQSTRIPQIGDKFASRHGQKGVIGLLMNEWEMPFTESGIIPDIILNPHAIPSRMTIGQMLESLTAKECCLTGNYSEATAFTKEDSLESVMEKLKLRGYDDKGWEVMINPMTGRKIASLIFVGPTFYQRLKHMTEDKIHVRSIGPRHNLTRQPISGIQRDGGLRFGEMERDCSITHGGVQFLTERLYQASDKYEYEVCDHCGLFMQKWPSPNEGDTGSFQCRFCFKSLPSSSLVQMPYAFKLLVQELNSMSIKVRLECNYETMSAAYAAPSTVTSAPKNSVSHTPPDLVSNLVKTMQPFHSIEKLKFYSSV